MKHARLLLLFLFIGGSGAVADTLVMPPFTYAGRVMNYMRTRYQSEVTVYARHTNGVLVARTSVFTSDSSSRNYALAIPLASAPTEQMAVVGETLRFEVDDGTTLWTAQELMPSTPVGNPGTVVMADIVLLFDLNKNGVADAYEELIETLRFERDGVYEAYDPNADYDGDGFPNGQEYVAGTDPLSASETFTIDYVATISPTIEIQKHRAVIRFYAMRGRTYSVVSTGNLSGDPAWAVQPFRLTDSPDAVTATTYLSPTDVSQEGNVTLYVDADAATKFYRLCVE